MGKTNTGLSELVARGGALLASRRVRFWAAVLATALVGGALSVERAHAQNTCRSYFNGYLAAPSGSDERIRYYGLWRACRWGGVNRAEQIRETGACLSDNRRGNKSPSGSDEKSRYFALFDACVLGGVNRAEQIRETGACLSDYRKYWKTPVGLEEEIRYFGLFTACLEGGENLAAEIRETGACLSDYRKGWDVSSGLDEELRQYNLFRTCLRENPALEQAALAASFGVQAFETIIDDMVATLKKELGQSARPTLLVVPIHKRVGENIDAENINDSIEIRLSKVRFFTIVSRNHLRTLLEEKQLEQSGLADRDTAVEIGHLLGAQYVLQGSVSNIRTRERGDSQIAYRVVLRLIDIETGTLFWADEAQVSR